MISVIVPAFNAAHTLPDCLKALQTQSVPRDCYEVIVVDDGSTDQTPAIARQSGGVVITQANRGAAAARNAGTAVARGDLLLFTDADCAPNPDWIAAMSTAFADPAVVGVKGVYRTKQRALMARFVQLEYEDKYDRMAKASRIDFIDTYSAGYRRDVYVQNGGFDERLMELEDQEFSFRLSHKGYALVFAPAAIVYHQHNDTLAAYLRRKFEIGYWKSIIANWHPDKVMHDSHTPQVAKVQIGLVGLMLAGLPVSLFVPVAAWLEVALVALFLLSTLPFALKAARKDAPIGLLSPAYLWFRALALGFGLVAGFAVRAKPPAASRPPLTALQRTVKRALDLSLGGIALVCSLPVWAVVAVCIKLDSHGPVFFVQKRVGENGRVFDCVKFRTMVVGAEASAAVRLPVTTLGAAVLKVPNDPRVTRAGRVLRRTSLDETPNLINVLRGEMSLVGPRPEEVAIVGLYNDYQRKRLAVKPGITGPMQINGRGALTLDERVRLELDYIQNYSLARDLAIMLKTIPEVVKGRGAY